MNDRVNGLSEAYRGNDRGLQSISLALICYFVEAPNGKNVCIVQVPFTSACLYCAGADLYPLVNNNTLTQKGSSGNKKRVKSIWLGVQF